MGSELSADERARRGVDGDELKRAEERNARTSEMACIVALAKLYASNGRQVQRVVRHYAGTGQHAIAVIEAEAAIAAWVTRMDALERLARHYVAEAGGASMLRAIDD